MGISRVDLVGMDGTRSLARLVVEGARPAGARRALAIGVADLDSALLLGLTRDGTAVPAADLIRRAVLGAIAVDRKTGRFADRVHRQAAPRLAELTQTTVLDA